MRWARRSISGLVVVAVMAVAAQMVSVPHAGVAEGGSSRAAEVLARIEVRGWSVAPPMGRSTEESTTTPGLSPTPSPSATTPVAPAELDGSAELVSPVAEEAGGRPDDGAIEASAPDLAERGAAALELIAYPWRELLPEWQISFEPRRDGLRGLTFTREHRIEIYVRDGDSADDIARVIAHELGHAVDLDRNEVSERAAWRESRGIDDAVPWWPDSGQADFATGAGDFAECFATWQVGSATLSQVASDCTADDLALMATLATS